MQLTKQNKCENYYIRERHCNVDCFYLAQNYFLLPRQTIRENTNFICLFPQDDKNVDHIYRDHVSSDMKKEEFKKFCKHCWSQPHGFAVIDLSSKKDYGKYRRCLDDFFQPLHLIYLPIVVQKIFTMETQLVDQNGRLMNFRGEDIIMRFHIRERISNILYDIFSNEAVSR